MRRSFRSLALAWLVVASASACAAPGYLGDAAPDLRQLLPPPPAAGSPEDGRDFAAVLELQRSRTPAEVVRAQADEPVSVFRFADVLGEKFRAEDLPKTAVFFKRLTRDGNAAWDVAKKHWQRPRPFVAHPEVQPVLDRPVSYSYPSGHSAAGWLWASVLGQMVPEKRSELYARAREYARNRVVGGLHYPTDAEAGALTGTAVAALLMQNPEFRADLADATVETRRVLGL